MNKDTDNVSLSNNNRISICFSILIISIIILIFCDKDVLCYLLTPVYTVIFVSISYLFLETKKCRTENKSGGFVETKPLFNYKREDIENEKIKLLAQNEKIAKILDTYDCFEKYNIIQPVHKNINNDSDIDNTKFKSLNDLNLEEIEEEAADMLKVMRTDFIPIGLKKILLSKINNRLSFSDGIIKRIIETNKLALNPKMFNQDFINIVKKTYLDSKKGLEYINGRNISERFLNEQYLLKPDFSSEIKSDINMLERDKILNDETLSQCGKLLYSMLSHEQKIVSGRECTDYYFSGKLMSESNDESLEQNITNHSKIIEFFENMIIESIDKLDMPPINDIDCNVYKTGSAELTPKESKDLKFLNDLELFGLNDDQKKQRDALIEKQRGINKKTNNATSKLTLEESKELAILLGKVRFNISDIEKKRLDELLIKQGSPTSSNLTSKSVSKPIAVTSKKADSKTPIVTSIPSTKKTSKNSNTTTKKTIQRNIQPSESKLSEVIRSEAKVISTADSIKEADNISEDEFKKGLVVNDRVLLEDRIISEDEGKSILSKFAKSVEDEKNGINVFSRNLILKRPKILLLSRNYLDGKTNSFDGQLQAKDYNKFRDTIYKHYMFEIHDLHLRFMAHFISNKKRLLDLSSIDDKCLERINKIGDRIKTLEEEVEFGKQIKDELETLKYIEKEAKELRAKKYELEIELEKALKGKGSWKTSQELEQKTAELENAINEKELMEKKVKELNAKNSEILVSSSELKSETTRLQTRLKNIFDEKESLIEENKEKDAKITKLEEKIKDLNDSLKYLSDRENRIIAETKFSDKILKRINNGRMNVKEIISIVEKLKNIVVEKYDSNKSKLLNLNKKTSSTINKLETSLLNINSLVIKTNTINSNYNNKTLNKDLKDNIQNAKYKNEISQLNVQMNEVKRLLKPFFVSNGTGFEYLKQHLENLQNEKKLIKEELSKINFSILSEFVKTNASNEESDSTDNSGRFIVNSEDSSSKNQNFAEFVSKYNNELDINKRIKLFNRLNEIDTELYKQYNLIERYNLFVDKIFKEFKKINNVNTNTIFRDNDFLKEYEFLALNYRQYILNYKKVKDMNNTLVSKNNILSKRINELSLENKILSDTISSKEPDKLIINMKDDIVRLNDEIEKYYKDNGSCVQDLEELKNNLKQSMLENSELKDTILRLETEIESLKKEYKNNLASAIDTYSSELNEDLDTMVILLNGSNNVEWDTNNVNISNTKKKQLFIISKIKELLLSNDNSKKIEVELEKMKEKIKSLNKEAEKNNIIIAELREAISSGKDFINTSGIMSSSNVFKTNSELYEEEKNNMQKNIKLLEDEKKRILGDLEYLQTVIEKSNKESREVNENSKILSKSIAKASDYMSTPLGFHTKNALTELFKCISSNSIKRILFHKIFKKFFTKEFAEEFKTQKDLNLNITNLGNTNIFEENALIELYNYTIEDGKETNIYTDIFSNYLKKIYSSNLENIEKQGKAESSEDDNDFDDIDDTVEYIDYETEPDPWDYSNDEEYKKELDLFKKKKENKSEKEDISTNDIVTTNDVDTTNDIVTVIENIDGKLIFLLILDKLNIINKESEYYKTTILPLFNKYRIRENSFNDENFLKECFNNVNEDTNNYINKIRNLDLSYGNLTKSILENSSHVNEKKYALLSLEAYIDEIMEEKYMISNLYSLDKYENMEMDYLLAINILDIKNYELISKYVKKINSKLNDVKFMLNNVGNDLIDSIIPEVSNLNKNYFSVINSLKNMLFSNKSRAESFIERELKKISKTRDYNKFNEVQAIILSELNKKFLSLNERLQECEGKMDSDQKIDSELFNTKGLLQVYQNKISEISKRFNLYSLDVKEITTVITNNIAKIQTNKDKLNIANTEILKLKDTNSRLKEELSILYEREDINLAEIKKLNKSLEQINNNISNIISNKASTNQSITSLDKDIDNVVVKIKENEKYIKDLSERIDELSAKEIGRNKINYDIKKFIIDMTPEIKDELVISRLNYIKKSLDEKTNTIKEKEDEKELLTNLNNQLVADRDRIISDVNNLLNESINSDDKEWMNEMDKIGIKLDIINKFIEKWENNGNNRIRVLVELLKNNKDVSMSTISKLNSNIADIADIDFIIQKIQPYVKKPEELVVKYNSELLEYRDELQKVEEQKNLLEKELNTYISDRRKNKLYLKELDEKLRKYIDENNAITSDISNISFKYNQTLEDKKELEENVKKMETEINNRNIEILRLGEEILKQKDTILEMTRKIDLMELSSKSKIDKKQCSDYVEGIIDSIVKVMSDKISSVNDITRLVEIISNRWSKGNLDISKYIEKNKLLEEEIKKLSKINIDYEKSIKNFKKNEQTLKDLTMVFQLFTNKSDKTILQKLKLKDLKSIKDSVELEKYLDAKINLSSEIVRGFLSVVNNYEVIRNILNDTDLIANIKYIISKCNSYKNALERKNIEELSNINELLLTKDELEERIKTTETNISLLLEEKNQKISEKQNKLKNEEYIAIELNKIDNNTYLSKYKEDIEYVQNILMELESIIRKDNIANTVDSFKPKLLNVVSISKKILNEDEIEQLNIAYENISEENIVNVNPLIQNLLRRIINKNKEELLESKRKELMESINVYNKDITKEILTIDSSFDKNISSLYEKLDKYKLLHLKASGRLSININDINKCSGIIEILKSKISNITSDIEKNKKEISKVLKDKQDAIEINKKLKSIEIITIDTANILQKNIDEYNKDIIEIKIYLGDIINDTKNLKETHSKIIENLLLSKEKSEKEKKEAIEKYNKSLEIIETTSRALKQCNSADKQYRINRDLSIIQLNTDLIEAKKLLDYQLINLNSFVSVVKQSIDSVYKSVQEINIISAMTGEIKESINRKLAIKEDADIINTAVKNKEIYEKIIKEFKSPIEKQILKNKLLAIELNSVKSKIDIISKNYVSNERVNCVNENKDIQIVEEFIYVDRNNIILPSNGIVNNKKKVKEPLTDYDKYRKQLVKQ